MVDFLNLKKIHSDIMEFQLLDIFFVRLQVKLFVSEG